MNFQCAITELEDAREAAGELSRGISAAMPGEIDMLFLFFTTHHLSEAAQLIERVRDEMSPRSLLACSAEGVIGGEQEIERSPAVVALAAHMPGVNIQPLHIGREDWEDILNDEEAFRERLGHGPLTRAIIGAGDPFTTPTRELLERVDGFTPGVPLIGGMASSANRPGENVLGLDDEIHKDGFIGVSLSGRLEVETVVSQGCRPIGLPMVITRARENVIEQLGGRPALAALRETIDSLEEADKRLLQHGLFVGRAISEYRETFGRGDFLVRNVMGIDQKVGAMAVTDYVRVGQTVQFHVRDAATADEDLKLMLAKEVDGATPAGGLLFSCNGRGTRLFAEGSHDIKAARAAMPQTPIAGFFAAGELGPVGGRNFIHGHTASFALFRPKSS